MLIVEMNVKGFLGFKLLATFYAVVDSGRDLDVRLRASIDIHVKG
jgi:hypothetical protein